MYTKVCFLQLYHHPWQCAQGGHCQQDPHLHMHKTIIFHSLFCLTMHDYPTPHTHTHTRREIERDKEREIRVHPSQYITHHTNHSSNRHSTKRPSQHFLLLPRFFHLFFYVSHYVYCPCNYTVLLLPLQHQNITLLQRVETSPLKRH